MPRETIQPIRYYVRMDSNAQKGQVQTKFENIKYKTKFTPGEILDAALAMYWNAVNGVKGGK